MLQQSPLELESTRKITVSDRLQRLSNALVNRSVHEVVHIDTTMDNQLSEGTQQIDDAPGENSSAKAAAEGRAEESAAGEIDSEVNLSPTFHPDKLQQMRE